MAETRDRWQQDGAASRLALACALIALGGVLLGLQRASDGAFVGVGYSGLAMGALIALVAALFGATEEVRATGAVQMPRDALATLSAGSGYLGFAFLAAGVLVPGGPWMFAEALVLLFLLSRAGSVRARLEHASVPRLSRGALVVLGLMLLFRLWVTYQGCRNQWAAMSVDVPVLSDLAFLPSSVRGVALGSFTASEFGIPTVGLVFSHTFLLWAAGFALCAAGLWLRQRSSWEHENDRVHATLSELPPRLAALVERLLPEEEWPALGLHHLSERQRKKRIGALTEERVLRQLEVRKALTSAARAELATLSDFALEIREAVEPLELPAPREDDPRG